MPFVEKSHRLNPDPRIVGDLCYQYYKDMVGTWKQNPRWTTAHEIYLKMRLNTNCLTLAADLNKRTAYELAWQVFFNVYVMEYEQTKRKLNGDI
jgi:hypothetical protein